MGFEGIEGGRGESIDPVPIKNTAHSAEVRLLSTRGGDGRQKDLRSGAKKKRAGEKPFLTHSHRGNQVPQIEFI